eukprot:TRINITY_DN394_c0_g1_i15.p2 TRINITY_DN394_c0_g1~~TRINITY_DN394_c0_g1_i15.p2  ORF type:complete len:202 (+),score=0.07 TRINITY_DN394_c0_g1_i15:1403-2008(+)
MDQTPTPPGSCSAARILMDWRKLHFYGHCRRIGLLETLRLLVRSNRLHLTGSPPPTPGRPTVGGFGAPIPDVTSSPAVVFVQTRGLSDAARAALSGAYNFIQNTWELDFGFHSLPGNEPGLWSQPPRPESSGMFRVVGDYVQSSVTIDSARGGNVCNTVRHLFGEGAAGGLDAGEVDVYMREIGRAVQQECRDRSRMPSSA